MFRRSHFIRSQKVPSGVDVEIQTDDDLLLTYQAEVRRQLVDMKDELRQQLLAELRQRLQKQLPEMLQWMHQRVMEAVPIEIEDGEPVYDEAPDTGELEQQRACRKALKRVKKSSSADNTENYRIVQAESQRTLRASRHSSWQKYVSSINSRTSIKKVSNFIGKISGKKSLSGIHHLSVNGQDITFVHDIANTLADTFSNNSSSENFTDTFNGHGRSVTNPNPNS